MAPVASNAVTGIPDAVLLAPDSFKGTFSASEVAQALELGLAAAAQPADLCPVADGGEGTLAVLAGPMDLELVTVAVSDPLGRELQASFGLSPRGVAVVEMATASGLGLVPEDERDAVIASSYGTGELIAAAIEAGARLVHVTVGGSATSDGGAGAVAALNEHGGPRGARLVVLCDVRTPFELAAEIFAPQKGATPAQVKLLSARLQELAAAMPRDPRGVPMTGAAGGLAGGLWAHFDAELTAGASAVLAAVDYDVRMRRSLAVVTGEGRLDRQSLVGKLVSEVATRARQAGVPCHAVVGRNELDLFDARILDLQLVLEASTLDEISAAGEQLAAEIAGQRARGA
jgi:glycerate kinase